MNPFDMNLPSINPLSQELALVGVAKLTAIASVIVSLEYLVQTSILRDGGLMGWAVGRLRHRWHVAGVRGQALDTVLGFPRVLALLYLRLAVGCFIALGPSHLVLSFWAVGSAALLSLLFWLRTDYGHDGADQMVWISFAGLALLSLAPTGVSTEAFLWFIALMACHAYVTAGVAKATAKRWRDGSFLPEILGTRIYGNESVGRFLHKRPALARVAALAMIGWECGFILVFILPQPFPYLILASGVVFHFSNAAVMGLNTFFWAFVATYPAIIYCRSGLPW